MAGTSLTHKVHGSLSREGVKVAFLGDGKEEPQDIYEDLKNLRNSPKVVGISGKALWQLGVLVLPCAAN